MRYVALFLCGAVVGYAIGDAGREASQGGRARSRAVRAERAHPAAAPDEANVPEQHGTAAQDLTSDEAWKRMVEATPCPPRLQGMGRIHGVARDASGQPLAGVDVTAVPDGFPGSANDLASRTRRFVSRRKWEALSERRAAFVFHLAR